MIQIPGVVTDDQRKEKLDQMTRKYAQRLMDWRKHNRGEPPIIWSEKLQEYVWVDRATRRRLGMR